MVGSGRGVENRQKSSNIVYGRSYRIVGVMSIRRLRIPERPQFCKFEVPAGRNRRCIYIRYHLRIFQQLPHQMVA